MPLFRFQDIIDQLEHVDDPDALEEAKSNGALAHALQLSRPENWRGSGLTPEQILPLALEDGIPVAWVPPTDVLQALVAAPKDRRLELLLTHRDTILDKCRTLVRQCSDAWIKDQRTLVDRALDAFAEEHHEAAMALAVVVGEPLAVWASEPRVRVFDSKTDMDAWENKKRRGKYCLAKAELAAVAPTAKLRRFEVLRHALIGPIPKFFTPFHGEPGELIPDTVSRHATVHKPIVAHFSVENALLALMLVTSILREEQEWCVEVRMDNALYEEP